MPWAVAAGAGALAAGAIQADAAKKAAKTQAGAQEKASDVQQQMFNTVNDQQAPYRQAGVNALSTLTGGFGKAPPGDPNGPLSVDQIQALYNHYLGRTANPDEVQWQLGRGHTAAGMEAGMPTTSEYTQKVAGGGVPVGSLYNNQSGVEPGQFAHQFNANDLGTNLDPSYAFRRDQTLGAANNLLNKSGSNVSGNTLKGIMDYGNNLATTGYQQAFENYNTNQTNIYNRLASIAGLGQAAGSNATTGASTFAGNIGNQIAGAGASMAGGQVGSANALAGGVNNAMGWYQLNKIMNPSTQPTGTAWGINE